ncbi:MULTISPECIES: chromate transporter [Paenibacillus]|uniref:chromate transporter n=1 Tax=Paenibacillus TaxID=44249 RepID=UPI0022B93E35|nr:chromate transporter [Paenibacillus caseinilyticus]MCZ8519959.1 chromate transporter [Paenibacillus caseinilyticus]
MLWTMFITFLKIGLFSFGGGYAMIPLIRHEVLGHGWLADQRFTELVALAGMAPGPVATNSATLIGYEAAGAPGAFAATTGMILPSLILIIVLSAFLFRWEKADWVATTFYGLKPVITGMIFYAAVHFLLPREGLPWLTWHTAGMFVIVGLSLFALVRYKLHPLAVLALSSLLGIAFFQ